MVPPLTVTHLLSMHLLACAFFGFTLLAGSCAVSTTTVLQTCHVRLEILKPDRIEPGENAIVEGHPFTSAYDTAVYVDDTRATLLDVTRLDCDACDTCIVNEECGICSDCDACDATCAACFETATFLVPKVGSGQHEVRLFNRHGESNALSFEIAPVDTGIETGSHDTGTETGSHDTGTETGSHDTGAARSGATRKARPGQRRF
jgi:hypothetical protein